jgi:prepilin-type N-terminal cleavage/methylation domain-containing protein
MRGRDQRPDDAGFSLIEVMVTMGIMSVLMVIFTSAILQIYGTSATAETISFAQTQIQLGFQRFDRELRYASWIAVPGQVGTTWYVEFAGADPTQCQQLRLETGADGDGVLQLFRWTRGTPPTSGTPGQTVASLIVMDDVDSPFVRQAAGSSPYLSPSADAVGADFATDFQRLRIRLTTRVGRESTQVDTTFTAMNTSRDTAAANDCSEGRPV